MKPQLSLVDIDVPYPNSSQPYSTITTPAVTTTTTTIPSVTSTKTVPLNKSLNKSDGANHRFMDDGRPVPPLRHTSNSQLQSQIIAQNSGHVYETIKL